jgi:hypothetical protein
LPFNVFGPAGLRDPNTAENSLEGVNEGWARSMKILADVLRENLEKKSASVRHVGGVRNRPMVLVSCADPVGDGEVDPLSLPSRKRGRCFKVSPNFVYGNLSLLSLDVILLCVLILYNVIFIAFCFFNWLNFGYNPNVTLQHDLQYVCFFCSLLLVGWLTHRIIKIGLQTTRITRKEVLLHVDEEVEVAELEYQLDLAQSWFPRN